MHFAVASVIDTLPRQLDSEERFFRDYLWCLNPLLTVRDAAKHLTNELTHLVRPLEPWQRLEVLTNVYLLGSALWNTVDDYLRGPALQLPGPAEKVPGGKLILACAEKMMGWRRRGRVRRMVAWKSASSHGSCRSCGATSLLFRKMPSLRPKSAVPWPRF